MKNNFFLIGILLLIGIFLFLNYCYIRRDNETEKITEHSDELVSPSYEISFCDNTPFSTREFKVFCPIIQFEEANIDLEERINNILYDASTSWLEKAYIKESKSIYKTDIYCHDTILSIGQSYTTNGCITNNYITIDMVKGEQIFLNDIISDENELVRILSDARLVTTSRNAFSLDQEEADDAIRRKLRNTPTSEIHEMLRQCSLPQDDFPLLDNGNKVCLPYVFERANFYITEEALVIEEGEWHNKIILKFKDIDHIIKQEY